MPLSIGSMRFLGVQRRPPISSALRPLRPELCRSSRWWPRLRWSGRVWMHPNAFGSTVVAVLRCCTAGHFHAMVAWQVGDWLRALAECRDVQALPPPLSPEPPSMPLWPSNGLTLTNLSSDGEPSL
jgi:hypothetical protein